MIIIILPFKSNLWLLFNINDIFFKFINYDINKNKNNFNFNINNINYNKNNNISKVNNNIYNRNNNINYNINKSLEFGCNRNPLELG
jgi:hypothetical protein